MGGEIIKVDKAPFRAAVQPLFDEFKKIRNRPPCWQN
jgi:TRAP-type C4-dicarboxylate transport system substrate-binding protein